MLCILIEACLLCWHLYLFSEETFPPVLLENYLMPVHKTIGLGAIKKA